MIRLIALLIAFSFAPVLLGQISVAGGFTNESVSLSLNNARSMVFAPDGRLFYTEFDSGQIMVIDDPTSTPAAPTVFATISGRKIPATGDTGTHGITLHPNFPSSPTVSTDRFIYVCYTGGTGSANFTIKRFTEDINNLGQALVGSETTVVPEFTMSGADANFGGRILFSPGGELFASVGDGGIGLSGGFAQDPNDERGKIHRYNANGTIPVNNPFTANPMWALGMRNPRGMAFNPNTGDLFGVDTGNPATNGADELNVILSNRNYGWDANQLSGAQNNGNFDDPVWDFGSTFDPSGVAFFPVLGTTYPVDGYRSGVAYVGSEAASGAVARIVLSGGNERVGVAQWTFAQGYSTPVRDVVFGPDDNLYVLTDSDLYRIRYTGNTSSFDPMAVAGNDQTANEGTLVTLDATGSSDGDSSDILRYTWRQIGGSILVSVNNPTTATPTFTAPSVMFDQSFTFQVIVEDGNGGVDSDVVLVTINDTGENGDDNEPRSVADNGYEPFGEGGCSTSGAQSCLWLLAGLISALLIGVRVRKRGAKSPSQVKRDLFAECGSASIGSPRLAGQA